MQWHTSRIECMYATNVAHVRRPQMEPLPDALRQHPTDVVTPKESVTIVSHEMRKSDQFLTQELEQTCFCF
jgi:hypothetical protein